MSVKLLAPFGTCEGGASGEHGGVGVSVGGDAGVSHGEEGSNGVGVVADLSVGGDDVGPGNDVGGANAVEEDEG